MPETLANKQAMSDCRQDLLGCMQGTSVSKQVRSDYRQDWLDCMLD